MDDKKDLSAKDGIAAKPLANLFEVWISKREIKNNKLRKFFNNGDRETMLYLANKRAERK